MVRGKIEVIDPVETWQIVTAINKHFASGSYDAIKYRYKMKWMTPSAFYKRKDQFFYKRLASKLKTRDAVIMYAVANNIDDNNYIGKFTDDAYLKLQKRLQSFGYAFKRDIKSLADQYKNFDYWFKVEDGHAPPIIKEYMREDIMPETVCVLNVMIGFMGRTECDDLLWTQAEQYIKGYTPFVKQWINWSKYTQFVVDTFKGEE